VRFVFRLPARTDLVANAGFPGKLSDDRCDAQKPPARDEQGDKRDQQTPTGGEISSHDSRSLKIVERESVRRVIGWMLIQWHGVFTESDKNCKPSASPRRHFND
jgi:hypothetical protein